MKSLLARALIKIVWDLIRWAGWAILVFVILVVVAVISPWVKAIWHEPMLLIYLAIAYVIFCIKLNTALGVFEKTLDATFGWMTPAGIRKAIFGKLRSEIEKELESSAEPEAGPVSEGKL